MAVQNSIEAAIKLDDNLQAARILLVDDDPGVLHNLKQVLEAEGYCVVIAGSIAEARKHLKAQIPDIIICDIMLPESDGHEFYAEVSNHPAWYTIPFLFLSALSSGEHVRKAKESGIDDYLTKPCDPEDLLAAIRGKLRSAQTRKKLSQEQFNSSRKRIIHTLSHEFRTPLVSINTGTELLLDQLAELGHDQVSRLLRSIWRGGQRLEKLVDDFMVLQQIDLGQALHSCKLYQKKNLLLDLVETAIECFPGSYEDLEHSAPQIVHPEPDFALSVFVYDVQVINLIQRLLHNAYKFGGAKQAAVISYGQERDRAFVRIRDYGPGMDNLAISARIACETFVQINRETYEQQGCGLGLSICAYYAHINGGKLSLHQPAEGQGLEAGIDFPVAE